HPALRSGRPDEALEPAISAPLTKPGQVGLDEVIDQLICRRVRNPGQFFRGGERSYSVEPGPHHAGRLPERLRVVPEGRRIAGEGALDTVDKPLDPFRVPRGYRVRRDLMLSDQVPNLCILAAEAQISPGDLP